MRSWVLYLGFREDLLCQWQLVNPCKFNTNLQLRNVCNSGKLKKWLFLHPVECQVCTVSTSKHTLEKLLVTGWCKVYQQSLAKRQGQTRDRKHPLSAFPSGYYKVYVKAKSILLACERRRCSCNSKRSQNVSPTLPQLHLLHFRVKNEDLSHDTAPVWGLAGCSHARSKL